MVIEIVFAITDFPHERSNYESRHNDSDCRVFSLGVNEFEGGCESDVDKLILLLLICCVISLYPESIEP